MATLATDSSDRVGKLDPAFKTRWVEELRSGRTPQAQHRLRKGKARCCLGVAVDVAVREGKATWVFQMNRWQAVPTTGGGSSERVLPGGLVSEYGVGSPQVSLPITWEEITQQHPRLKNYFYDHGYKRWEPVTLTQLNDAGLSFLEIADLIEELL